MLTIRSAQIDALRDSVLQNYVDELVSHLYAFARRHCDVIGRAAVRSVVVDGLARAEAHGFTQRGPVQLYVELMFMFGSAFDSDPQLRWVAPALAEDGGDAMERAARLHRAATDYLDAIAGPAHVHTLAALRRLRRAAQQPLAFEPTQLGAKLAAQMAALYPEKCVVLGAEGLEAIVDSGRVTAHRVGLTTLRGEVIACSLAFALGHGFADDALYPWVGRTLADPRHRGDPERLAQRLERRALTYLDGVLAHFGLGADV